MSRRLPTRTETDRLRRELATVREQLHRERRAVEALSSQLDACLDELRRARLLIDARNPPALTPRPRTAVEQTFDVLRTVIGDLR